MEQLGRMHRRCLCCGQHGILLHVSRSFGHHSYLRLLAQVARQLEINQANQEFAEETLRLAEAAKAARKALQLAKRKQQQQMREVDEAKDKLDSMVKVCHG